MKTCTKCIQEKDLHEFSWKNKQKGIRQPQCKTCVNKDSVQWYQSNRDRHIQTAIRNNKEYVQRNLDFIRSVHLCCEQCGEDHESVLDFHHINPKTKDREVSWLLHSGCSLKRIQREIKKCSVLCSNCHRKEHWNIRNKVIRSVGKLG